MKHLALTKFDSLSNDEKREAAIVNMWLRSKSKTTAQNYMYLYNELKRHYPNIPIWNLDTLHFSAFFSNISKDRSRRTLAVYRTTLSSLMDFQVRIGTIKDNPVGKTDRYKFYENLRGRVLTKDQVRLLVDKTSGRDRAIFKLLFFVGFRASELVELKWRNISFEEKKVRIEILGKGEKVRHIFVKKTVFSDILEDLGVSSKGGSLERQVSQHKDKYLVQNRSGGKLSRKTLWQMVSLKTNKIIGRKMYPHSLRHTSATQAIVAGAPIHTVMKSLGHSSLQSTQKYLHVMDDTSSTDYLDLED